MILNDPDWPEAINEKLICTEEEKIQGIIHHILPKNLDNLKYLDYEGNSAKEVKSLIARNSSDPDYLDFAPYDVILCFDIIDHRHNPDQILKKLYELLAKDGKLYLRTHPYTSRHATHVYKTCNKAYVHLILTGQEEQEYNIGGQSIQITYTPIKTYDAWIKSAGFKIVDFNIIKEKLEPFFLREDIVERILKNPIAIGEGLKEFPERQMEMQFIDYVLSK